jgi:UDPglucose 6-dehydrogenase
MKIGIIGIGMVGTVVRHGMVRLGHDVSIFDIKLPETAFADVLPTDLVFLCVPTPANTDGTCNTSIVERVVSDLAEARYKGLVVIKSTVQPGTTDKLHDRHPGLRLAYCPEFLREKAAYTDFVENHDVCVIGTYTTEDFELIRDAHDPLPKSYAHTTPLEAEFSKYFLNVFNALRIVYANQFYDVCKAAGADYQKVKNAITKHRVIPPVYLDANENFRGYGGACLPKDTTAFAEFSKKLMHGEWGLNLFEGIVEINKRYKQTVL